MCYAVYREATRRRRGWVWGPWSCVASASLCFRHLLVENSDFPSLHTSWTHRSVLLSACTAHISLFCISILWLILPKPYKKRYFLVSINIPPAVLLLGSSTFLEMYYDVPLLLAGGLAAGSGVMFFGASTGGKCTKMGVFAFYVMYVTWLYWRLVTPEDSYGGLEVFIPAAVITYMLFICGLWLSLLDEQIEYKCFLEEEKVLQMRNAIHAEVEAVDDVLGFFLPKFVLNNLLELRASKFPVIKPDNAAHSEKTPLLRATAEGALPLALTRLLGLQWDMKFSRRCFVTVVAARVCDIDVIFREGTMCQGGDIFPQFENLFDSLERIGSENSVEHIMYEKGVFIACAGLEAAMNANSEQMLNSKDLADPEQLDVASFALSAVDVANKWLSEGADAGLQLSVGVSSGYVSFVGVTRKPVALNMLGLPVTEAVDLALSNESDVIFITLSTIKLLNLVMVGLPFPVEDMKVLNMRGNLTPVYLLKSGDCNLGPSLMCPSGNTEEINSATNSITRKCNESSISLAMSGKLGKAVDESPCNSFKRSDEVARNDATTVAASNSEEQRRPRLRRIYGVIGTRLLGLILRRPFSENGNAVEQTVRDVNNLAYLPSSEHLLDLWRTRFPPRPLSIKQQMLQPRNSGASEMYQSLADDNVAQRGTRIASLILVSGIMAWYGMFFFPRWRVYIYRCVVAAGCCCLGLSMFHHNEAATRGTDKGGCGGGKMRRFFSALSTPESPSGILAFSFLYLAVVECNESFLFSVAMALPWIVFVCPGYILPYGLSLRFVLWGGLFVVCFLILQLPQTHITTFKSMTLLSPSIAVPLRWLSLLPSIVLFLSARLCIWYRCEDSLELVKQYEKLMTVHLLPQIKETMHLMNDIFSPCAWPLLDPYLPLPHPTLEGGENEMLESLPLAGATAVVLPNTWVIYADSVSVKKMEGILEPGDLSVFVQKVNCILATSMTEQVVRSNAPFLLQIVFFNPNITTTPPCVYVFQGVYSIFQNTGSHVFIVPEESFCNGGVAANTTAKEGENKRRSSTYTPISRSSAYTARKSRIKGLTTCVRALQAMERDVTKFNQQYRMGLSFTVGLAVGDVRLGFIGGRRMSWDVIGEPVLQARALASYPLSSRSAPVIRICSRAVQYLQEMSKDPENGDLLQWLSIIRMDSSFKRNNPSMDLLLPKEVYHAFVSSPQYCLRRAPEVEDFRVVGLLGQGGSGIVYRAIDSFTGKSHAIKKLDNASILGMTAFTRVELKVLSRAKHPNVVSFNGCLQSPQSTYLIMDYTKGVTLGALLRCQRKGQHFSVKTLQFWFGELANALEYIHGLGIIHRDVKPDNLWISMEGHLQLMDFGLSKIVNIDEKTTRLEQEGPVINEPTMRIIPDESHKLLKGLLPLDAVDEGKETQQHDKNNDVVYGSDVGCTSSLSQTDDDELPSVKDNNNGHSALSMLIVDHDYFNGLMKKSLIKRAGYTAFIATSCHKARKFLFTQHACNINVLLVGWDQPGVRKFLDDAVPYMHAKGGLTIVMCDDKSTEKEANESGLADLYISGTFNAQHIALLLHHVNQQQQLEVLPKKMPFSNNNLKSFEDVDGENLEEDHYFTDLVQHMQQKKTRPTHRSGALSDPPLSSEKNLPSHNTPHTLPHIVGTLHMIAPEVISNRTYSFAVDWWSYGVCLYESATGLLPFVGNSISEVYKNATKGPPNLTLVPDSNDLREFIELLLQVVPSSRLGSGPYGAKDVKGHNFFSGIDLESLSEQNGPNDDDPAVNLVITLGDIDDDASLADFYPDGRMPVDNHILDNNPIPSMSFSRETYGTVASLCILDSRQSESCSSTETACQKVRVIT